MIPRQFIVDIKTQKFKIRDNFQLFSIDYYWVEGLGLALNEILNSLHLSGLSCILFSIDHIDTESAIFWALLIECFGTISEAVESSIYFQKSACVTLRSFINKIKSQGPNFDPRGTPDGIGPHVL